MPDEIQSFYTNYDEDGRLLVKHGQVEFLTTMRYIDKYLTAGAKILEVGAGGRDGTVTRLHGVALRRIRNRN